MRFSANFSLKTVERYNSHFQRKTIESNEMKKKWRDLADEFNFFITRKIIGSKKHITQKLF